jgi:hypothetical protein
VLQEKQKNLLKYIILDFQISIINSPIYKTSKASMHFFKVFSIMALIYASAARSVPADFTGPAFPLNLSHAKRQYHIGAERIFLTNCGPKNEPRYVYYANYAARTGREIAGTC